VKGCDVDQIEATAQARAIDTWVFSQQLAKTFFANQKCLNEKLLPSLVLLPDIDYRTLRPVLIF